MPLGMIAKDSLSDLASLAREAEDPQPKNGNKSKIDLVEEGVSTSPTSKEVELKPEQPLSTRKLANPQQAQEEPGVSPVRSEPTSLASANASVSRDKHRYSGFSYSPDEYGHHDPYSAYHWNQNTGDQAIEKPCFMALLPCLFPWSSSTPSAFVDSMSDSQAENGKGLVSTSLEDADEVASTSSDNALGEKLSSKERQAVLARLKLTSEVGKPTGATAQTGAGTPEVSDSGNDAMDSSVTSSGSGGFLKDLDKFDKSSKKRGILKRNTNSVGSQLPLAATSPMGASSSSLSSKDGPPRMPPSLPARRRSLFPQVAYESLSNIKKNILHCSFAPMARVITVKSKNDMSQEEKGDVWWQKCDYDDFRKTGRIITKAMAEGGSEIWLATHRSPLIGHDKKSGSEHGHGDIISQKGDKWWHKFGHSRRGLEHVVSMEEGRQRQKNVRTSIQCVLEEQNSQKLSKRTDAEKLRMVYLQYSAWARDLAFAAGNSDADAVRSSFNENRKSREFYLLKMARNAKGRIDQKHMPEFMQPTMRMGAAGRVGKTNTTPSRLDAHTSAQIRFRRSQVSKPQQLAKPNQVFSRATSVEGKAGTEPIHDSRESKNRISMARRAAGFSSVGDEKVDMAAVLTGMGAMPQDVAKKAVSAAV